MNFQDEIIKGLSDCLKCGWELIFVHNHECQGRKYKGKKITGIFMQILEKAIEENQLAFWRIN